MVGSLMARTPVEDAQEHEAVTRYVERINFFCNRRFGDEANPVVAAQQLKRKEQQNVNLSGAIDQEPPARDLSSSTRRAIVSVCPERARADLSQTAGWNTIRRKLRRIHEVMTEAMQQRGIRPKMSRPRHHQ